MAKGIAKKRGRGRPKIGQGAARILTTIEKGLLKRVDRHRKSRGLTRAEMIAKGLELVMQQNG